MQAHMRQAFTFSLKQRQGHGRARRVSRPFLYANVSVRNFCLHKTINFKSQAPRRRTKDSALRVKLELEFVLETLFQNFPSCLRGWWSTWEGSPSAALYLRWRSLKTTPCPQHLQALHTDSPHQPVAVAVAGHVAATVNAPAACDGSTASTWKGSTPSCSPPGTCTTRPGSSGSRSALTHSPTTR